VRIRWKDFIQTTLSIADNIAVSRTTTCCVDWSVTRVDRLAQTSDLTVDVRVNRRLRITWRCSASATACLDRARSRRAGGRFLHSARSETFSRTSTMELPRYVQRFWRLRELPLHFNRNSDLKCRKLSSVRHDSEQNVQLFLQLSLSLHWWNH